MIRIGILGSGFVSNFYMEGLKDVRRHEVVANFSRTTDTANEFGARWDIPDQYDDMAALCARSDIDLVLIGLPNFMHLEGARIAAEHGKHVVCTKPLGRNAEEAAEMVRLVKEAGVMAGYAETEVFAPAVVRVRRLIEDGALGEVLMVRAREGHSGPHSAHFLDKDLLGGGALLDMGCHTVEVARYFFGKHLRPKEVFCWGDTLQHAETTDAEDNAVLLLRFEDGRMAISEASWTTHGGMELRNEVYGSEGRAITDTGDTNVSAFVSKSAGYLMEKAEADTGWVFPLPEEAMVYGYKAEMQHFVDCVNDRSEPRETFLDGYIVNSILDAAYRSMESGEWTPVEMTDELVAGTFS